MIVHDNPVRKRVAISFAIDRLIAGHTERAGVRWQGTVVGNVIVNGHIDHPVVWWPQA